MMRKPINKRRGAKQFNHAAGKTNRRNVAAKPQRGGWRL